MLVPSLSGVLVIVTTSESEHYSSTRGFLPCNSEFTQVLLRRTFKRNMKYLVKIQFLNEKDSSFNLPNFIQSKSALSDNFNVTVEIFETGVMVSVKPPLANHIKAPFWSLICTSDPASCSCAWEGSRRQPIA